MGVTDYGSGSDTLASPSLGAWAASVAAALDNDDTTVDTRIAAAVGNTSLVMSTLPAVGKWAADPLIASAVGGKATWYADSYFLVGATGYNIDRISINVTTANAATTLTVTTYQVTANGTVDTGSPVSGASGDFNVSTTGQKDLTVAATLPAGTVAFRFSGAAFSSATSVHSKRRVGIGANINSDPKFNMEPYPVDSNIAVSNWEVTVYVRRAT